MSYSTTPAAQARKPKLTANSKNLRKTMFVSSALWPQASNPEANLVPARTSLRCHAHFRLRLLRRACLRLDFFARAQGGKAWLWNAHFSRHHTHQPAQAKPFHPHGQTQ